MKNARDSDDEDDCKAIVPTKRASYYRKMPPSLSESALEPANGAAAITERTPLERLLSASEEGELATVLQILEEEPVEPLINLHGHARRVAPHMPKSGPITKWGHPEALTCYRGDTALRYAAFHGYLGIVKALLKAGALPRLRNDDAKGALNLAELGAKLTLKTHAKKLTAADLPRGDPAERKEVIALLKRACAQQYIVIGCTGRNAKFNGRVCELVAITDAGQRLAVIRDCQPTEERPYFEKSASCCVYLDKAQTLALPPPPPPMTVWPADARFTGLPGEVPAAHGPPLAIAQPITAAQTTTTAQTTAAPTAGLEVRSTEALSAPATAMPAGNRFASTTSTSTDPPFCIARLRSAKPRSCDCTRNSHRSDAPARNEKACVQAVRRGIWSTSPPSFTSLRNFGSVIGAAPMSAPDACSRQRAPAIFAIVATVLARANAWPIE